MIECCLTNQSGTLHASNHWFIPFKHECPSRNLTGITYCIGVSLSCKNTDFFHTESQVISYTKIRRYSAQIFCSILRFINSVHGSDPLSARFFPFSRKAGANYLYIGLSLSFQLSGFLLIFSVNVKLFRACHLSKKGETFLPRDFYSIVKLGSFQPTALISRADFFLHLSNGWNASFHMPLLFYRSVLRTAASEEKWFGSVAIGFIPFSYGLGFRRIPYWSSQRVFHPFEVLLGAFLWMSFYFPS